ncbi:phosphotransferase [Nocardiopsis tropica]|uniref:Phosphotransferase n=1 Tax=Nocardiopsis tropica TaxID=109330 RepID=A0ABU7KUX7_9ACTN|nr:phosphotransferase [Nocardiopsis umidischolae]MEE2053103.1 phosphotransferase [Nocardiopsis umidischolae]
MTSSSPDNTPDLEQAWHHAVAALDLAAPPDAPLHHGVGGRTLSGPVTHTPGDSAWLRVESATKAGGRMWEGNRLAEKALPPHIRRPRLIADYSWGHEPVFQALLFSRVDTPSVSPTPDLQAPPTTGSAWWTDLRTMLHRLRQVPAPQGRRSHTPGYIERIPHHLPEVAQAGVDLTVRSWVTSHADLHWANVTRDPLTLLDWEGWGAAPAGYDAAVLHAYSLAVPETAAKVREVFADMLDNQDGRLAHLVICAEIVQAAERDPLHARLAPYARRFASEVLTPQ